MKKKRFRVRFDWYLESFLVPFILSRREDSETDDSETDESTRYSESEILSVVLAAAEQKDSQQINVHAATAAFRLLLEQIDEVNARRRKRISKELVDYFRYRFLEIIGYGHSYVVSDGRYKKSRELDLNELFGVPRQRGREKDVSLFQRLDTAYQIQQGIDAAARAGEKRSFTSIAREVSKRTHCEERTARNRYHEFADVLKIFDQDRFFEWKKDLKAEYVIFQSRLKCEKRKKRKKRSGK